MHVHVCRLESAQRQKGYWSKDANLRKELEAIVAETSSSGSHATHGDGVSFCTEHSSG